MATPPIQVYDPAQKWPITVTLSLGMIGVGLGITGIDTAIPAMMSSLGTSLHRIQWVSAFMITPTCSSPSVGWLGQAASATQPFILAPPTFGWGSCPLLGPCLGRQLVIFVRIVQGIGVGAHIRRIPCRSSYEAFPRQTPAWPWAVHDRLVAGAVSSARRWGFTLAQYISWRTIFYLPLPTIILAIVAATFILPRRSSSLKPPTFDFLGFVTLTGGLVTMLLGLTQGQEAGWTSQRILSLFGAAALLVTLFIMTELRAGTP